MDVEGYEPAVLKGAEGWLLRSRVNHIIFEYNTVSVGAGGHCGGGCLEAR